MSDGSVFKVHLKVLKSSADRHLYDSEFQIEGVLTVNAFADNASFVFGTNSNNLSDEGNVRLFVLPRNSTTRGSKPSHKVSRTIPRAVSTMLFQLHRVHLRRTDGRTDGTWLILSARPRRR